MGVGGRTIGVVIALAFDLQAKVSARDHWVGCEEDVDRIVNSRSSSNDLGIVVVKIGVREVDIAFDGGAVHRDLPQILAYGLGGGNRINGRKGHDFLVQQRGIHHIIVLDLVPKR
jgi:hypothetical protein